MAALQPPEPPLTDGTVTLRLPREADADRLVEVLRDPEIVRWTRIPAGYTRADFDHWLVLSAEQRDDGTDLSQLIVDAEDNDRILGCVGLHSLGEARPDIGYWTAPEARGRGVAPRGVRLVHAWACSALGRDPEILVHPDNAASQRAAERAGFRRTGALRPSPRDPDGDPLLVFVRP